MLEDTLQLKKRKTQVSANQTPMSHRGDSPSWRTQGARHEALRGYHPTLHDAVFGSHQRASYCVPAR